MELRLSFLGSLLGSVLTHGSGDEGLAILTESESLEHLSNSKTWYSGASSLAAPPSPPPHTHSHGTDFPFLAQISGA